MVNFWNSTWKNELWQNNFYRELYYHHEIWGFFLGALANDHRLRTRLSTRELWSERNKVLNYLTFVSSRRNTILLPSFQEPFYYSRDGHLLQNDRRTVKIDASSCSSLVPAQQFPLLPCQLARPQILFVVSSIFFHIISSPQPPILSFQLYNSSRSVVPLRRVG